MKTVIFDFADTIAHLSPSKESVVQNFILDKLGVKIELEKIARAYHYLDMNMFYSSVNIQDSVNKKEFYNLYNEKLFYYLGLDDFSVEFYDYFVSIEKHWMLKEGVEGLFAQIVEKGYKIGIISNFDKKLKNIVSDLGIGKYISFLVISADVGFEKPNEKIFTYALSEYELDKDELFYVGDNYNLDYHPTKSLGIKTFLYDEKGFFPKYDFVINRLNDILPKLDL